MILDAPKLDGFIGNERAVTKLKASLEDGLHCLLYGDAGTGKTSSVYVVAEELGYTVSEYNMSEDRTAATFRRIEAESKMKPLTGKILFLLDEADGIHRKHHEALAKLLEKARSPIVLTANDKWRLPKTVDKAVVLIRFYRPRKRDIVSHIRAVADREGEKPVFRVSGDVRSSLIASLVGGENYERRDSFKEVEAILKGRVPEKLPKELWKWLLDNALRVFRGRVLYEYLQRLALVDSVKRTSAALECLPRAVYVKRVNYPRILRKMKAKRLQELRQ